MEELEAWCECLEQAVEEMDCTGLIVERALELYKASEGEVDE